jgi:C4-dicarboxylate-specific signal transduction histidine kinase
MVGTLLENRKQYMELAKAMEYRKECESLLIHSSKMAALGEMAGGISHEINNPLSVIFGKVQRLRNLAESGRFNAEQFLDQSKVIEAMSQRIATIIKSLRSFARDGSGDPFVTTSVKTMLEDTLELCHAKFKQNSIELRLPTVSETLHAKCRAVEISQVLLNLLSNAFDAALVCKEKWVQLDVREDSDWLEFSVTDSGNGIDSKLREKIMQPFFTTKEIGKGAGLGLSISKGFVDGHHGSLFLDTGSAHTRFVVRIPKHQKDSSKQAA